MAIKTKSLFYIIIALAFLFIACSSRESPQKAAREFLEAAITGDLKVLQARTTSRFYINMSGRDPIVFTASELVGSARTSKDLSAMAKATRKAVSHELIEEHGYTAKVRLAVNTNVTSSMIANTYNDALIDFLALLPGYDGSIGILIKDGGKWRISSVLSPEYSEECYNRGNSYLVNWDYDQAISEYTKAIEINPDFTSAYLNRGVAYGCKKNYDQAIADFDIAIKINPRFADAYYARSITYYWKGDHAKSNYDANTAIRLHPNFDFANAYLYRGTIYSKATIMR